MLGGAVALVVTLVVTAPLIAQGLEWILEKFGLAVGLLIAAIVVDVRLALQKPALTTAMTRRLVGGHLMLVFAFGVASLWQPSLVIGGVSLE